MIIKNPNVCNCSNSGSVLDLECKEPFHVWLKFNENDKLSFEYVLYDNEITFRSFEVFKKWQELGELPYLWKIKALNLKPLEVMQVEWLNELYAKEQSFMSFN